MINVLDFYTHIDIILLIFCRILFAIVFIPVMVEAKLPVMAKAGATLALTVIVYYTIPPVTLVYEPTVFSLGLLVIKEAVVGLIMGFGVIVFFQVYYFVGNLLSMQGGLGMSNIFDPINGTQLPVIGKFYYLGFSVIFLMSGGFHWFISSVVESFTHIPIGQAVFSPELTVTVVQGITVFWELSFKLATPILAVIFIVDCGLGILARTVPQMNMFVIGLPLKLMILLVLMVITIGLLPAFNNIIIDNMVEFFFNLSQGMVPR